MPGPSNQSAKACRPVGVRCLYSYSGFFSLVLPISQEVVFLIVFANFNCGSKFLDRFIQGFLHDVA